MSPDIRRFNMVAGGVILACVAIVLMFPAPPQPGRLFLNGDRENYLSSQDFSGISQQVIADARSRSEKLFGATGAAEELTNQMLGTYRECLDKDILVIFNAGGFGWDSVVDAEGWISIMHAITGELEAKGNRLLVVDFQRSHVSLEGIEGEAAAILGLYSRSDELASRVSFLTGNLPGLKVLLLGESNGATIVDETMEKLESNNQVYAIETGPPPTHKTHPSDSSLILTNNGSIDDSFSQGDILTIVLANFEALLGVNQQHKGDILFYIGAPGHYYSWEYEGLRDGILRFLDTHFA